MYTFRYLIEYGVVSLAVAIALLIVIEIIEARGVNHSNTGGRSP